MKKNKSVLLICFDIPFPDNYGGVIDVWKRIVHLKKMGFTVHVISFYLSEKRLQAFNESEEGKLVDRHFPIKSKLMPSWKWITYPLSMAIRFFSEKDARNLGSQLYSHYDYVIVEHTKLLLSFFTMLQKFKISFGKKYLRMHNCEAEYYLSMAQAEKGIIRKLFYRIESLKYRHYEKKMLANQFVDEILFISDRDKEIIGPVDLPTSVLPILTDHAYSLSTYENKINTLLFVGNLDLSDNIEAVKRLYAYLADWLALNSDVKLVIAGKKVESDMNPFSDFSLENVELFFNISNDFKENLMNQAKVFCSFSMNPAGVKLKTLEGASFGLPILANNNAVNGSGLENSVLNIDSMSKEDVYAELTKIMRDGDYFQEKVELLFKSYNELVVDSINSYDRVFS
ncbi:glycosyltransferase [Janthinobacterium sp. P210006]|uniref:glycosyltransferase n=1 Tax=Janthinobacterium sp. P210006 TaxID=3112939 RepID=UPI002E27166B|nr:glycosyltransferase [Janthinobacterium sp. P210006]